MKHNMNLNNRPFKSIKEGTKTIELRLNDEKRSLLKVGDEIEFTNRDTNENMEAYYSKEEQNKYGVLGIEIRKK